MSKNLNDNDTLQHATNTLDNYHPFFGTPLYFVVVIIVLLVICSVASYAWDIATAQSTWCAGNWSDYCQDLVRRGLYVRGQ